MKISYAPGIENVRIDPMIREDLPLELQMFDERQKPKFEQGWERVDTLILILVQSVDVPLLKHQGTVEVWCGDAIPAETGRSASFESRDVVCEAGDKHLHDLWGEPELSTSVRGGDRMFARACTLEFSSGTFPNSVSEKPNS